MTKKKHRHSKKAATSGTNPEAVLIPEGLILQKRDEDYAADSSECPSSLLHREVQATKEKKLKDLKKQKEISCVAEEIGKLSEEVSALEGSVLNDGKDPRNKIAKLKELLMGQLLNLDGIVAEEKAKELRKLEVRRIQALEKKLEDIEKRYDNHCSTSGKVESTSLNNDSNTVSETPQSELEIIDSGVASFNLNSPPPSAPSATPCQDSEQYY